MKLLDHNSTLNFLTLLATAQDKGKGLDWLSKHSGEPLNVLRRQVRSLRREGYDIPLFPDEIEKSHSR